MTRSQANLSRHKYLTVTARLRTATVPNANLCWYVCFHCHVKRSNASYKSRTHKSFIELTPLWIFYQLDTPQRHINYTVCRSQQIVFSSANTAPPRQPHFFGLPSRFNWHRESTEVNINENINIQIASDFSLIYTQER